MKHITAILLVLFALSGCKKTIEKKQEDLVLMAMTNGYWKITSFTVNGTDITADFANYRFKYYENRTVDAIKNGSVEQTGQWDGNAENRTTWANFNGAIHPMILINGTWNIINNSWTFVSASQTSGADTKVMRLDKE